MSRPRVFTDEECKSLAVWYEDFAKRTTFTEKARELGVSNQTLYNAIQRGLGNDDSNVRQKLKTSEAGKIDS